MSSYTMQLREFIESYSQNQTNVSTKDQIETGRTKLFDFDYPIFDVAYKKVFETHFIRRFYMREIGAETEGLFKFNLETWLIINMPYFNKLFESELIVFDPLKNSSTEMNYNKKKNTDGSSDSTGHSSGTATQNNFDRQLHSDNPDSRLSITANDGEGVIEYASDIQENTENNQQINVSDGNSSVNSSINDVEDYIQYRSGKIGVQTYSKMLTEYRNSFIRIENKIFDEMQELFMLVY